MFLLFSLQDEWCFGVHWLSRHDSYGSDWAFHGHRCWMGPHRTLCGNCCQLVAAQGRPSLLDLHSHFSSSLPKGGLTLSHTSPGFYMSAVQVIWNHWGKRSNFSFSHSVFYPFEELSAIFIKFEIVVYKVFEFGRVWNLSFGKKLMHSFYAFYQVCHYARVNYVYCSQNHELDTSFHMLELTNSNVSTPISLDGAPADLAWYFFGGGS